MWFQYRPYVSVAERMNIAKKHAAAMAKKGHVCRPVVIEGRKIATKFWGMAWCDHMESHCDAANRLPRGRAYVRNGSVFDLRLAPGKITALVSGSEIYQVEITLKRLPADKWNAIKRECGGQVASAVELLRGTFSDAVMKILTEPAKGMFPSAREFDMDCSCPDGVSMCKHIAAVLYAIGNRLDHEPNLFFTLRDVNPAELIAAAGTALVGNINAPNAIAETDMANVFGVDFDAAAPAEPTPAKPAKVTKPAPAKAKKRVKRPAKAAAKLPPKKAAVRLKARVVKAVKKAKTR